MSKRFILVIAAVVLAAILLFYFWPADGTQGGDAQAQSDAQPVSVIQLRSEQINLTKSLPGRVSAFKQSQIRPQVDGIITRRLFEEGVFVKRGTQLYQIDDARFKAALASARADLQSANATIKSIRAKLRRYGELVQIEAVSRQEYEDVVAENDQALAAIAVAKAAVDVAKVNLDYTKVYAPISGKIGRSLVTAGTLVTANQANPLAVITQLDPIYVDMQQSGEEAMSLRTKMAELYTVPVTVLFGDSNAGNYPHTGSLKFSEVTIDESTGSIILRALIPNPDRILLPGLFVRGELNMGEQEVVLVPQRATIRSPEGHLNAWVVDANKNAEARKIKATDSYKDFWIVSSGVKPGETLIVEGYQKVKPGGAVDAAPWKDPSIETAALSKSADAAKAENTEKTQKPLENKTKNLSKEEIEQQVDKQGAEAATVAAKKDPAAISNDAQSAASAELKSNSRN